MYKTRSLLLLSMLVGLGCTTASVVFAESIPQTHVLQRISIPQSPSMRHGEHEVRSKSPR
jgi:hypothetical protein